jgi:chromosome segregation ATPase
MKESDHFLMTKELIMDDEKSLLLLILKRLDALTDDVSELKSDMSDLKSDVSVLKLDVAELRYEFGVLRVDVDFLSESHLNLSRLVIQMNGRLTALEDHFGGNGKPGYGE